MDFQLCFWSCWKKTAVRFACINMFIDIMENKEATPHPCLELEQQNGFLFPYCHCRFFLWLLWQITTKLVMESRKFSPYTVGDTRFKHNITGLQNTVRAGFFIYSIRDALTGQFPGAKCYLVWWLRTIFLQLQVQ